MNLHQKIVVAVIAIIVLAGCSLASEPIPAGPIESGPGVGDEVPENVPVTLPRVSDGQVIFAARCASCHGAEGAGDGAFAAQLAEQGAVLPDFTNPAFADQRTPQEWYTTITLGTIMNGGLMPPWREALTDSERWSVTYYLYSLSHDDDTLALGEQVLNERCADCVSSAEALTMEQIAAMSPAQIQNVLAEGAPQAFEALSEAERFAVARWVQTFGYDASPAAVAETTAEPTAEATIEATTEPVPTDGTITVRGVVTTAAGETVPAGIEVKLTGVEVDGTGTFNTFLENTTTTGEDGSYQFAGLPFKEAEGGAAYVVTTTYNGVDFNNGAVINADTPLMDLPIVVLEVTSDASVISVESANLVIRENPDTLLVLQVMIYNNDSDLVYLSEAAVGGQRGSVVIDLPADAQNVTFEDGVLGGRFVEIDGKIYDTQPIQPGQQTHQVLVQYVLPHAGRSDVELPLTYGAAEISVLTQGDAAVTSEQINPAGTEDIGGEVYERYMGSSVAREGSLLLNVGPKGIGASLQKALVPLLIAITTLLAVALIVYWIMQRRNMPDLNPVRADAAVDALIGQIATLDTQYDAGAIKRLEYEAQRAELKAKVAERLRD